MKRKILITGTSSGIGFELAKLLLEENFSVVGLSRRNSSFNEEIQKKFSHFSVDLSDLKNLEKVLKKIQKEHADIDGLVCNAGKGFFGNFEQFSFSQIQQSFDLNFLSPALLSRFFLPFFKKKKGGDIFFIGSVAGVQGKTQGSVYCSSKFALRGLAQSIREECASSSVRVHLVEPGMVRSPFYDTLHFAPGKGEHEALHPKDVAELVAFLLKMPKRVVCEEILLSPLKKCLDFSKTKLC